MSDWDTWLLQIIRDVFRDVFSDRAFLSALSLDPHAPIYPLIAKSSRRESFSISIEPT
jgi:hypothetical protein